MAKQKRNIKIIDKSTNTVKFSTLTGYQETTMLFVLFLVAFAIRMLSYGSIFVGDKIRFLEFDPFYHMRRAVSFAQIFPNIWNFDTYLDYPYGSAVGWPPLMDWTIALIANIIGLGHPSKHLVEIVGVYFPVFVGSLSVIVLYFITKEMFDCDNIKTWQIGLVSGLILAVIPAFVQISFLGFVDHHVAEVLLSTTAFLFFIKTLKAENTRKRYKYAILTIIVLVLAMYTWPGTPIFIGIIAVYAAVQCVIDKKYKYLFTIIGALLVCYIGLYFISNDSYNRLNWDIGFLTKDRVEIQQVQEAQPLFFTFSGKFTMDHSWYAFNIALYVAIIGAILFVVDMIKNGANDRSNRIKIFFLVWTLITLILNLYQTRFVYLFAVNIAILCAYFIVRSTNSSKVYIKVFGAIATFGILVLSAHTVNDMTEHPLMFSDNWFAALDWLKNNTPDTGNNWNMPSKERVPSYGIMSWWDYGNYILYLSERPVVANNFQLGAKDSAKFYTSENETEANKILTDRKVRYVILDYRLGLSVFRDGGAAYLRGAWVAASMLINKSMDYYLDKEKFPNERYFSSMYARLYLFNGKGLDNYKLVYQSKEEYQDIFGNPIAEIKIFEYNDKL